MIFRVAILQKRSKNAQIKENLEVIADKNRLKEMDRNEAWTE